MIVANAACRLEFSLAGRASAGGADGIVRLEAPRRRPAGLRVVHPGADFASGALSFGLSAPDPGPVRGPRIGEADIQTMRPDLS